MSIHTDDLIDAVLDAGCEFDVAQNISDRNEVKKILLPTLYPIVLILLSSLPMNRRDSRLLS